MNDWLPIPGYTGHCPGLKFNVGHSFTWAIMHSPKLARANVGHIVTLSENCNTRDTLDGGSGDTGSQHSTNPSTRPSCCQRATPLYKAMPPIHGGVSGYTGFIPGRKLKVGYNYRRIADDHYAPIEERREQIRKEQGGRSRRSQSLNRVESSSSRRTEIRNQAAAEDSTDHVRLPAININSAGSIPNPPPASSKVSTIDCIVEIIPIPGYTGTIPGLKSSNLSVGKSFSRFATEGIQALHKSLSQQKLHRTEKSVKFEK